MRYAKVSCANFILVIYSNASQLTYSLIRPLAMTRRVIWIRSVRPSAQTFSWSWLFSFLREPNMVLGVHVVLCMTARFFEKNVFPSKRGKLARPRFLWMYRKVQFFLLVLYFFISLVYNESLYYCSFSMPEQISYLGKFWFLRYGPKCSWPIRLRNFSINRGTLKLAVSNKEINETNWFLVCLCNSFLRNGPLCFSDFWRNGR